MIGKLLTRNYIFSFVALGALLALLILGGSASSVVSTALKTTLAALAIVGFFDLLKVALNRERTSYRTMLMERPLFNPRSHLKEIRLTEPLYPRFIALYFDADNEDPYKAKVHSIQAVRYEEGYLTDSLYLPLKLEGRKNRRVRLTLEEALKYLKTYTRDFPLIVHQKAFANTWLRENSSSVLLTDAIDTESLARNLYPKLQDFGIEDLNDWFHFEVDDQDPVYGAKIATAIYLDYQRLHRYRTRVTWNPLAAKSELEAILPDDHGPAMEMLPQADMSPWLEDEPAYQVQTGSGGDDSESGTQAMATHYVGPFTPLDEEGNPIPERGFLIERNDH